MKSFRFFHLLFAAGVATAWLTAEEFGLVHAWAGYAVAALIAARLGLAAVRQRGFELQRLRPRFSSGGGGGGLAVVGHAAAGRGLTLALILAVGSVTATGITMDKGGTLVGRSIRSGDGERIGNKTEHEEDEALVAPSTLFGLAPAAHADADRADRGRGGEDGEAGEGGEHRLLGEIHETLGNLLLPLVALPASCCSSPAAPAAEGPVDRSSQSGRSTHP